MIEVNQCPSSYETFIDIQNPARAKFVIWIFFNKIKSKNIIRCKECDEEFSLTRTRTTLVTHLKEKHYQNKGTGFYYSYQNYMDHLTQALHYERHNFSEVQKKNLKLSFGIRYQENFTLLRFPECRKNRTKKSEPNSKSAWQKQVCSSYIDNPVGSYQGHYDKPMNCKVYLGARPLSFAEYTEFTHSPPDQCNEYKINETKYESLSDLKKIESYEVENYGRSQRIKGPCSNNHDMSILYTCNKNRCIFPCVCKDCVSEEKQCQSHKVLHPGYFDPEKHSFSVRNDDSLDINLVQHDLKFDVESRVQILKYAGIEIDCAKCQQDLLHHQAYHLIHHELCKFCRNEKYKYENVKNKRVCHENMKFKYEEENCSCHICNRIFNSKQTKDKHVKPQHGNETKLGYVCKNCDDLFQSKAALEYHEHVKHKEEIESFSCTDCTESFKTMHSVNVHKRSVHNRRDFYCRKCSFKFKLHSHLLRHYRTVHDFDMKKFTNSEISAEQTIYSCTVCDFTTSYKQNLAIHMKSKHSDLKNDFHCDQCGSNFTVKTSLTRHILKVHGQAPEVVCEFCDFKTKFENNLRRHKEQKHEIIGKGTGISGRQLYSCKRCDFSTFDQNSMYNHNSTSHNIE